jgi:hypothetical protein
MEHPALAIAAAASAIDSGDMIADSITVKDMLGYNKYLVIDSEHPQVSCNRLRAPTAQLDGSIPTSVLRPGAIFFTISQNPVAQ